MAILRFSKMHGLGNDYLYVQGNPDKAPQRYGMSAAEISRRLSKRHFGAGSDGMIWIAPSEVADCAMRIFNADGSEAMMCGNGIRCVAKYAYERGLADRARIKVETPSGIREVDVEADESGRVLRASVGMGSPTVGEPLVVEAAGGVRCIPVDVGNPHAVVFVDDAEGVPVGEVGPLVERSPCFPDGVNVEFVEVRGPRELRMRVWERGSGITMACGTGACASVAAALAYGLVEGGASITVCLDGGRLDISTLEDGSLVMVGPAEFVYEGEVEL